VKVAVIALYFFLFAFGLIKALPFICIVSPLIGNMALYFLSFPLPLTFCLVNYSF
jgi:hypothetical protein